METVIDIYFSTYRALDYSKALFYSLKYWGILLDNNSLN